jgi:hypothetical protein
MLCMALMLIQGGRRLYESIEFAKPSNSQMWVVHWLLGLCFYAGITTAVWIEGAGTNRMAWDSESYGKADETFARVDIVDHFDAR